MIRAEEETLGREEISLGECCRALGFVLISTDRVTILIKMVVESRVDRVEFLTCLHPPKSEHFLGSIVEPPPNLLILAVANLVQRRRLGAKTVGDDGAGLAVPKIVTS